MEKLNVGILLFADVEVLDFAGPFEVLSRARLTPGVESRRSDESAPFNVFTVAREYGSIAATGGLTVLPNFSFENHPSIDLLVVPGGFGTRALLTDDETLNWIRKVSTTAKLTTSVCTGALLLSKVGLLDGLQATTHWGAIELLQSINQTVRVLREPRFVDSGRIITSAGVSAGIDMALHIVEKFCGRDVAEETATYIEYRPSGS